MDISSILIDSHGGLEAGALAGEGKHLGESYLEALAFKKSQRQLGERYLCEYACERFSSARPYHSAMPRLCQLLLQHCWMASSELAGDGGLQRSE
jgi:hypothetical protein